MPTSAAPLCYLTEPRLTDHRVCKLQSSSKVSADNNRTASHPQSGTLTYPLDRAETDQQISFAEIASLL